MAERPLGEQGTGIGFIGVVKKNAVVRPSLVVFPSSGVVRREEEVESVAQPD